MHCALDADEAPVAACLLQRELHSTRIARGMTQIQEGAQHKSRATSGTVSSSAAFARAELAIERADAVKGISTGVGSDYGAHSFAQVEVTKFARGVSLSTAPVRRNKIVLMVLNMCPLTWILGLDRLFLGSIVLGILKFLLAMVTLGIGGVIWGSIDFFLIVFNALQEKDSINMFGMNAAFGQGQVRVAAFLAVADVAMIPLSIALARYTWWRRREKRIQQLEKHRANVPPATSSGN